MSNTNDPGWELYKEKKKNADKWKSIKKKKKKKKVRKYV